MPNDSQDLMKVMGFSGFDTTKVGYWFTFYTTTVGCSFTFVSLTKSPLCYNPHSSSFKETFKVNMNPGKKCCHYMYLNLFLMISKQNSKQNMLDHYIVAVVQ